MTTVSHYRRPKQTSKRRLLTYLKEQAKAQELQRLTTTEQQMPLIARLVRTMKLLRINLLSLKKRLQVKLREMRE